MEITKNLKHYIHLARLNKPIGIFLLLWPTLWALWLASSGHLSSKLLFIFMAGVVLMRSAGCVVNDFADRHFDGRVARTRERPLAMQVITPARALLFAGFLSLAAFILVLFCNKLTIQLAFVGAALAVIYPFMKRFTHLPQLGLGLAFAWGVPMAFAATTGNIPPNAWLVFAVAALWPVIYDTMYAMVDRVDDVKIGVKSTAILLGKYDVAIIFFLQIVMLMLLFALGIFFQLQTFYYYSLIIIAILFLYQQHLIKNRDPAQCFRAFLNNHWVGMVIFLGILSSYL